MVAMREIVPVILSGGVGSRLWPLSRTLYPKQLQALYSEDSMLVETAQRVRGGEFGDPIVICNADHRFIIAEQLWQAGHHPRSIVLEPASRNTAPAAAVAALMIAEDNPEALMLLMPSDHLIAKPKAFLSACAQSRAMAEDGALVTFGIVPHAPKTGFGYIRRGAPIAEVDGCFAVDRFVEKPDEPTAKTYLADGSYYWNSGIFLFQAGRFLEELAHQQPEMVRLCRQSVLQGGMDLDFFRLGEKPFCDIQGDSIDYAVMEKTENAAVVPVDMGWDDIGSWSGLLAASEKDAQGNILVGDVVARDVESSYVRSSGQLIAAIGLKDAIVVATDDAILVADRDRSEEVKHIVEGLKNKGREERICHRRVFRPWGWYQCMDASANFQVKQLFIKPGGVLSLQSHQHRVEHWVVVSGVASVVRGDEEITLNIDQSIYIPAGVKHRLENKGSEALRIIEVQTGSRLDENDIERFEDVYGRK